MASSAFAASHPDYTAFSVMNNALGQYAIGGRLGDSIRERQGMAYYVFSSLDASLGAGPFTIRAGVSADNVERAIASIDAELAAVLASGFTAQEIDESKSYLVGSLPRQLETNAAIASFLLNVEFFDLGLDYDVRLPGMIQARDPRCGQRRGAAAARSGARDHCGGRSLEPRGHEASRATKTRSRHRTWIRMIRAVFFDVDFTLIYPGPTFQAEGYRQRLRRAMAVEVDPARFDQATAASSFILDEVEEQIYNHDLFMHYTASIIEHMGGRGPNVVEVARRDLRPVGREPPLRDVRRCGAGAGGVAGARPEGGRDLQLAPQPRRLPRALLADRTDPRVGVVGGARLHEAASQHLRRRARARAACGADESLMVGDSLKHDVEGALKAGLRAVLLRRSGEVPLHLPPACR